MCGKIRREKIEEVGVQRSASGGDDLSEKD